MHQTSEATSPPTLTETARRGRIFLGCALTWIAFVILHKLPWHRVDLDNGVGWELLGAAIAVHLFVSALRGNGYSLPLIKTCLGVFLLLGTLGAAFVWFKVAQGRTRVFAPDSGLALLKMYLFSTAWIFTIWAMFVSRSVREYVEHQDRLAVSRIKA